MNTYKRFYECAMHTVHIHRHPRKSSHLFSSSFKPTFLIANEKKMYLSASSCCSCPCTQVLRLMYSGLRWRSLERKLRSCLREGRGAEVWGGGGSGARGARGRAVAARGRQAAPFSKKKKACPPLLKGFEDHGSPR